jgi:hypothetical protein
MTPRLAVAMGLLLALLVSVRLPSGQAFAPAARRFGRGLSTSSSVVAPRTVTASSSTALRMGLLDGLKKIVTGQDPVELLAQENEQTLATYRTKVEKINGLEDAYEKLSDEQLRARTDEFRRRLASGETLDTLLVEAFAVVREAAWRVLSMRHFDVQLMGGMALHEGRLAEMATGEGKTLVAVLPTYLHALTGKGAFVVTTSDYLSRRDGETMGQVSVVLPFPNAHTDNLPMQLTCTCSPVTHTPLNLSLLCTHGRPGLPCPGPVRRGRAGVPKGTPTPRRLRLRRDVRVQPRTGVRFPPRQLGAVDGERGATAVQLLRGGRGGLDPYRRGADAAHHLAQRYA